MDNLLGIGINVTFSGIVIVFSMLVLLVLILILFGKVGQLFKKETPKTATVSIETIPTLAPRPKRSEPSTEVIAVIAAAVATMYSDTKIKPVIKSIKRVGVRPVWASAGITDNTRPF